MVEVKKMFSVGSRVRAVVIYRDNEGPDEGDDKGQHADGKVNFLFGALPREVAELEHASPHDSQVLVAPDLVEVGQGAVGYAAEEAGWPARGEAEGRHNPLEEFEDQKPADENGVDDEDGVDRTQKVDVDVELRVDVVRGDEGFQPKEAVLYAGDVAEVVQVLHAGGVGQRDFHRSGKQPRGDIDVVVDHLHYD